ncbi:MAG: hypothetical protein XE12_0286, partial [Synergistales bacterium 54_9]
MLEFAKVRKIVLAIRRRLFMAEKW